jgi:hypothetical protein
MYLLPVLKNNFYPAHHVRVIATCDCYALQKLQNTKQILALQLQTTLLKAPSFILDFLIHWQHLELLVGGEAV